MTGQPGRAEGDLSPARQWEGRPVEAWRTRWNLPRLLIFERVASTNDIARQLADRHAPAGTMVLAEYQTAGRGRQRRTWQAPPGSSLLFSVLMRPVGGGAPGTAPLRIGLAIADALRTHTGIDIRIKWPNDLVVPGRGKIGGVLCEAVNAGGTESHVVAGIGINACQRDDEWSPELRGHATSIDACATAAQPRARLMGDIIAALRPLFSLSLANLSAAELDACARLDALRGHPVSIAGEPRTAIAAGIDADGALLVECDGALRRITAATVRRAPVAGRDAVTSTGRGP